MLQIKAFEENCYSMADFKKEATTHRVK